MHCLAEDVHPLLAGWLANPPLQGCCWPVGRAGTPPSPDQVALLLLVVVGISSQICRQSASLPGRLPGKSGPTPTASRPAHQTRRADPCACFALQQCARAHFAGRCCCLPESASYFGEWQKGGCCRQAGADCREVQQTGKQNTPAALSPTIKHTEQNTEVHKHTKSS